MKLSIVIPVYNGARTIGPLVRAVQEELGAEYELEVVLVNDGSPSDDSAEVCLNIARENRDVVFLDLARNFGEHNAVMAGLSRCSGEAAVILDDDFQNPPSEIRKLVCALGDGYDVVYSCYEKKEHNFLRNLGSRFNNLVASFMIGKPIGLYLSSFKVMNRFLIDQVIRYTGPNPYVDGLIFRITRNYTTVVVRHDPRIEGRSGYTVKKLISLWLNMFTNFSILPLRVATVLGFFISFCGFMLGIWFAVEKIRKPGLPVGWGSLIVTLLALGGFQLFALGMLGEYLGRLFLKDSGMPQFVVRKSFPKESDKHEPK